eukprot:gene1168-biopygen15290
MGWVHGSPFCANAVCCVVACVMIGSWRNECGTLRPGARSAQDGHASVSCTVTPNVCCTGPGCTTGCLAKPPPP